MRRIAIIPFPFTAPVRPALLAAGLLAAISLPAAARLLGDPAVAFSADDTVTVDGRSFAGKIHAVPGSQRHDETIGGMPQTIILHADGTGWLVLPALHSYIAFGFAPALAELGRPDLLSTPVGKATIGGKPTTEYRVEHAARDGSRVDGYLWLTREGIPMRGEATYTPPHGGHPMPIRFELSHLAEGPQPKALFALPPNLGRLDAGALAPLLGWR